MVEGNGGVSRGIEFNDAPDPRRGGAIDCTIDFLTKTTQPGFR